MDADTAFYKAFAESWKDQWEAAIAAQAVTMANLEAQERELEELRRQVPPSATSAIPWDLQDVVAMRACETHARVRFDGRWDITLKGLTANQKDAVMAALRRRQWSSWADVPDRVVVRADEGEAVPSYHYRLHGVRYEDAGASGRRIDWDRGSDDEYDLAAEGPFVEVDWANKPGE